jgi:hypothetical protein
MLLDPGSGREDETGPYVKPTSGPHANWGTVYVEAGCAGSVTTTPFGHHPVMFHDELQVGSVVLDVNSNRLDATFLRGSGVIGDYFTIIKQAPEPLRVSGPSFQDGGIVLTWKSICGEAYQVEQSDSGLSSDWQPASPPITSVGNVTSWTNAVSPGLMRFYRVLQLP